MKLTDFSINAYKNTENKLYNSNSKKEIDDYAISENALLKVPQKNKSEEKTESVYRRVAKFLTLIGIEEASKILPHLSPAQTEKIIPELASIKKIDSEEAKNILEEFKSLMTLSRENGGVNTAKNILEKAFGSKKADEVLEKAYPFKRGKPFEYLSEANAEKISILLKDESAPVRALVLSHLKPEVAAAFIQKLPDSQKKEVIIRLAKLKEIDPQIVAKVDESIEKKFNSLVVDNSSSIDGKNILSEILKKMDSASEEKLLSQISQTDSELSDELREKLFTIQDIINADDRFIQQKLQNMSDRDIALLIIQKDENFRNKILNNVSQNRKKLILETEENIKPVLSADVQKVTTQFFSYLRRSFEDGILIIKGRNDDIYV